MKSLRRFTRPVTVILILWCIIAPVAAFFGFIRVLLSAEVVQLSFQTRQFATDLSSSEWLRAGGFAVLALSAYVPLVLLGKRLGWTKRRRVVLTLLWPLPVVVFIVVCLLDLWLG